MRVTWIDLNHIAANLPKSVDIRSRRSRAMTKIFSDQLVEFDLEVGLSESFAKEHGLPRSVAWDGNPEIHVYGISVFHQLHCLDIIRRSLYPKRYFPNMSHEQTVQHYCKSSP